MFWTYRISNSSLLYVVIRILIRDLVNVVEILKIMRGLLSTRSASFRPVVTSILNLCSKVLLEQSAIYMQSVLPFFLHDTIPCHD